MTFLYFPPFPCPFPPYHSSFPPFFFVENGILLGIQATLTFMILLPQPLNHRTVSLPHPAYVPFLS